MIRVPYFPHPNPLPLWSTPYLGYVPRVDPTALAREHVATIVSGDGSERDPFVVRGGYAGDYVAVEYRMLERLYGARDRDWTWLGQTLTSRFEHLYDVLSVRRRDGTEIDVWFDITEPWFANMRSFVRATHRPAGALAQSELGRPMLYGAAAIAAVVAIGYVVVRSSRRSR